MVSDKAIEGIMKAYGKPKEEAKALAEKLEEGVKKQLASGRTPEQVSSELVRRGWSKELADSLTKKDDHEEHFTMDEFRALEEKEGNKKEDDKDQEEVKEKKDSFEELSHPQLNKEFFKLKDKVDDLLVELEKDEGKFEMEEDVVKSTNERIADLSQQIGELRQTIMGRERYFNKMEMEFEKMKEDIKQVEPAEINKSLEKKDLEIEKVKAQVDKVDLKTTETKETLGKYEQMMSKIKSFESLFELLKDVKSNVQQVMKNKEYTENLVNKMEMLFKETSDTQVTVQTFDDRLKELKVSFKNIKSDFDKVNAKIQNFPKKEEIKRIEKNVDILLEMMMKKESAQTK